MKSVIIFSGLCLSLWSVCHAQDVSLQEVSRSNWEFTKSLYKAVAKTAQATDSIIISPFSVQMALAMVYMGAGGETAKQMSKGIGLPDRPVLIKSGFQQLFTSLPSSEGAILEIANTIFPAPQYPFFKNFSDTVQEFFLSDIENVDYDNPSKAATTINEWVSKKTHNKITNIVSENSLDPYVKMVLINAVYFKGDWQIAFEKEDTSKAPFYVNGKVKMQVDTMHMTKTFSYQENKDIGAKIIELIYKDKSTMFVIVLPLALDGLPSVEEKLEKADLAKVLKSSKLKDVELSLPRFSLTQDLTLKDVLEQLGMVDMFVDGGADFSKMTPTPKTSTEGLFVSEVLHKATLDVDEEGTVASAATSVMINTGRSLYREFEKVEFVADHPFMFALVSTNANVVLFTGRYTGGQSAKPAKFRSHIHMDDEQRKEGMRSSELHTDYKEGKGTGKGASASLVDNSCLRLWTLIIVFVLRL